MYRHIFKQGPVIGALARTLTGRMKPPGGPVEAVVPPVSNKLIDDYIRHSGGSVRAYRTSIPPHLFPKWLFPLQTQCVAGANYPLTRALNGGGEFELKAPLPRDTKLLARSELTHVDDNGTRAIVHLRATTGPLDDPERLVAKLQLFVPLKRSNTKKAPPRVPADATEVARFRFTERHARRFVALTGDVNPIHWLPLAARKAGFRNVILHGYATSARAYETLVTSVCSGDALGLASFSFRFTKPMVLPSRPKLFVNRGEKRYWVGDAAGARPYAMGTYALRS